MKLPPGEEVVITRGEQPVAKRVGAPTEGPRPLSGRGKGVLTIVLEDDDQLERFAESMR